LAEPTIPADAVPGFPSVALNVTRARRLEISNYGYSSLTLNRKQLGQCPL